jgi:3-phosphoshikimate 1-carboxyvinyltransferase
MKIRVPGDKSISQRALILSSLARGESRVRGLVAGGDPASTAKALRGLGVEISPHADWGKEVRILGLGLRGLRRPSGDLDLENSGTGARLLLGVLAGQPMQAVLTGDESLRSRPMGRVTDPLSAMGARFEALRTPGRLPIRVYGGELRALEYRLPMASAQVKSALLLAGLAGGVGVSLLEPGRSRDHTERMLRAAGAALRWSPEGEGWRVELMEPPDRIDPVDIDIPGDFSSAAFLIVLALLGGARTPLHLEGVGLNQTRTGLLPVLGRMGGQVVVENVRGAEQGEPLGDMVVEASDLLATHIEGEEIPALIDEIPVLAVAALRARGSTRISGAGELRVKETDRIRALVENFLSLGVAVEELEDGLVVEGTARPLSGRVRSFGDHRIAMAFGVLACLPGNDIQVDSPHVTEVSFPGFWKLLEEVRVEGRDTRAHEPGGKERRPPVITLDGPAGSGKSTTAREVARRLGFRHLDSGALYRALTFALLSSGVPEERWAELTPEDLDRFPIHLKASGDRFLVMLGDRVLEDELRTPAITSRVSPLSALPAVRVWLLDAQRRAASEGGLVADGRDMGTVVFPAAEVKIFLTAELKERARRRFLEREGREPSRSELELEAVKIQERDTRDSARALAPLRKAEDALEVDTSHLTFDAQVQVIIDRAKALTDK